MSAKNDLTTIKFAQKYFSYSNDIKWFQGQSKHLAQQFPEGKIRHRLEKILYLVKKVLVGITYG